MQGSLGRAPAYGDMEEWTGVAEGTLKDWFGNKGRPTAEFLLHMFERLPEKPRHEILDGACRVWPTLDHSRLKCDQTIISRLKTVVTQNSGLTFIQGGNDENRTFLLTAMGHSFLGLTERPHRVGGIDVHDPDWFVPVTGVHYLGNVFQIAQVQEAARGLWSEIRAGKTRLVLLNLIWSTVPELQYQIRALARQCPVIVADAVPMKPAQLRHLVTSANLITVSPSPENKKGILVELQAN